MKSSQIYLLLTGLVLVALGMTACSNATTIKETTPTSVATTTPTAPFGKTPPAGGGFTDNRTVPSIDWATAANKLGVSEDALQQAFSDSGPGMPDMAKIATNLGVTEQALREALGFTQGGPGGPGGGQPPTGTPPDGSSPTDLPTPPKTSGTSATE